MPIPRGGECKSAAAAAAPVCATSLLLTKQIPPPPRPPGPPLTITTTGSTSSDPAPVPDRSGPNGTPRSSTSWFATTTPGLPAGAHPRSWLQSPRKWGQGRTPTHAQGTGDLTSESKRKAAYFATLPQHNGATLFGREEGEEGGGDEEEPTAVAVGLAGVVHQTDKDGRQLHHQREQQQQQQQAATSTTSSSSMLGRLLGRFSQLTVSWPSPKPAPAAASPRCPPTQEVLLLGRPSPEEKERKKCLVLDLDETLVHSSFEPVDGADFVVPIKIEQTWHQVYVTKRPGVEEFLLRVSRNFEVVVFTASLSLVCDDFGLRGGHLHRSITGKRTRTISLIHAHHPTPSHPTPHIVRRPAARHPGCGRHRAAPALPRGLHLFPGTWHR
jgi:hypothetical protein